MKKAKIFLCVTLMLAFCPAVTQASNGKVSESNSASPTNSTLKYVFPFLLIQLMSKSGLSYVVFTASEAVFPSVT